MPHPTGKVTSRCYSVLPHESSICGCWRTPCFCRGSCCACWRGLKQVDVEETKRHMHVLQYIDSTQPLYRPRLMQQTRDRASRAPALYVFPPTNLRPFYIHQEQSHTPVICSLQCTHPRVFPACMKYCMAASAVKVTSGCQNTARFGESETGARSRTANKQRDTLRS